MNRDETLSAVAGRLRELLDRTSRTFALSIPCLPTPTRDEVTLAYLLFRVADTLEDATEWPESRRRVELERFASLLEHGGPAGADALAAAWRAEPPVLHDGYRELLGELPRVLESVHGLAPEAHRIVVGHTRRTVERMRAFLDRRGAGEGDGLRTLDELRDYCYAVAGIVGEMLTELFLLRHPELSRVEPVLRENAARFGEALQLVNILRDAADDASEGRRYLPDRVRRGEIFALAREDLAGAGRYVRALRRASAPRGLVAFTAMPVLLAWGTLERVESDGPGVKLSRGEVAAIVSQLSAALERDLPLPSPLAAGHEAGAAAPPDAPGRG